MLSSVYNRLVYDAAHIYTALTGQEMSTQRTGPGEDLYYDIGDTTGDLIERLFDAREAGDYMKVAEFAAQLACPFHSALALFQSAHHRQFDLSVECIRRDLACLYDKELLIPTGNTRDLAIYLERHMTGEVVTFWEAYTYGNGLPLLRSKGKMDAWYNRAVHFILSFWLSMPPQSSKSLSGTDVIVT